MMTKSPQSLWPCGFRVVLAVEPPPAPNRIRNTRNCPQWLATSPMRCHQLVFQLSPPTRVCINFCGKMRKDWVERQPAPNRLRNTRNCPQWLVTSPMRCHRPVFQLLPPTRVSINFCGKMRKDWVEPQSASIQRIKRIAPWCFRRRRQDRLVAEPSIHSVVQSRQ